MTLELTTWRGARVPVFSREEVARYTTQDFINWLTSNARYMGTPMPVTTYANRPTEPIATSYIGFVEGMLYADGPVAAAEMYRLRVFGQAPLLYQEIEDGRPGDLFDDPVLDQLRAPWPSGTLSDLMKRGLIFGDFAGNCFLADLEDELVLLRPDWVEIVLAKRMHNGAQVGWKQVGIVYYEGGLGQGEGAVFMPGEYAHFVPGLPDPLATYRGMSWLTPLVREVQADKAAGDHKVAFFENAASPNLAVKMPKEITPAQFDEFVDKMDAQHKGAFNAYKTLYTGGGADVTVIGANMQQMDFAGVQGKGETRIANSAGVPPVLLSFSEGMQGSSLNAGNYTAAKRNFVDTTMRDLWQNFAGSLQQMDRFKPPREKTRLWYDGRDIPFLHEDAKDLAEIQQTRATTINSYITGGWKPESAQAAVLHDDLSLLEHTGLTSVQLTPPGTDVNGDGVPDEPSLDGATDTEPPPADEGAPAADFAALRGRLDLDDDAARSVLADADTVLRALTAAEQLRAEPPPFDDDLGRAYNPGQARFKAGTSQGGQWRSLSSRVMADVLRWLAGGGGGQADPLAAYSQPQLKTAAKQLGILYPWKGTRLAELKSDLMTHGRRVSANARWLAAVDALLHSNARQAEVLKHLDPQLAKRLEVYSGADPALMATVREAVETGIRGRALAAVADATRGAGLASVGTAGDRVRFDPDLHDASDVDVQPGDDVVVRRRGATFTASDGSQIVVEKAKVDRPAADADAPPAANVSKRQAGLAGMLGQGRDDDQQPAPTPAPAPAAAPAAAAPRKRAPRKAAAPADPVKAERDRRREAMDAITNLVFAIGIATSQRAADKQNRKANPAALGRKLAEFTGSDPSSRIGLTAAQQRHMDKWADVLGDVSKLDSPAKLSRRIATVLKARGVTMRGEPGTWVPYDPDTMMQIPDVSRGDLVRITDPAFDYTDLSGTTKEVRKLSVVAGANPAAARKGFDDHLFYLGRRKPTSTAVFDRAAQSIANGEDPKTVAAQMRRDANLDKDMSVEDRKTYQLLAGEVAKTAKPQRAWLNADGHVELDRLIATAGADIDMSELDDPALRSHLLASRTAPSYMSTQSKRWSYAFEYPRDDLSSGKISKARAVRKLRDNADEIRRRMEGLRRAKAHHDARIEAEKTGQPWYGSWTSSDWTPRLARELETGPAAAAALDKVADLLAGTRVPAKPRPKSLGSTELGDVLPIDESRFRYVPLHDAVVARGKKLDPGFKHSGAGPRGGVTYLFAGGVKRPQRDGLTTAESEALDYYTVGRLARALNGSLRKGKNHHGEIAFPEIGLRKPIDLDVVRADLDSAIAHGELARDSVLWRGVLLKKADQDRLVPGALLSDPGYLSTSATERGADKVIDSWRQAGLYKGTKPAKFKILAPAGTHGAVGHEQAYEVVLPRDQKLRVVREEADANGNPVFVMEVVSEAPAGVARGRDLLDGFDFSTVPQSSSGWGASVDALALQRQVYAAQGFDGLPKVVSKDGLDDAVKRGALEMFRGIKPTRRSGSGGFLTPTNPADVDRTADELAEQFRTGPLYTGNQGGMMYGRGTYATDRAGAQQYARADGAVVRMALRRDARVVSYADIRRLHLKAMPKALRDLDIAQKAELDTVDPTDTPKIQQILDKYAKMRAGSSVRGQAIADLGNFAAMMGFDAIIVNRGRGVAPYYVILNRTAVTVEEAEKKTP